MDRYTQLRQDTDVANAIVRDLKVLVDDHISSLLTAKAERHDHLTGIIKGLKTAINTVETLGKKWRAGIDLDDDAAHLTRML